MISVHVITEFRRPQLPSGPLGPPQVIFVAMVVGLYLGKYGLNPSPGRQHSGVSGPALLEEACASGYNPHCHFVLLLESVSFDHSFLLDLLISSETCFLEYFVQYLKCLLADWQGFALTCGRLKNPASPCRMPPACGGQNRPGDVTARIPAPPPGLSSPLDPPSSAPGLPLVDYSSSDESDHENGGRRGGSEEPPDVSGETSTRVLGCVWELREVVVRLHTKKLFPYNPAPLLKLLGQVQGRASPQRRAFPPVSEAASSGPVLPGNNCFQPPGETERGSEMRRTPPNPHPGCLKT